MRRIDEEARPVRPDGRVNGIEERRKNLGRRDKRKAEAPGAEFRGKVAQLGVADGFLHEDGFCFQLVDMRGLVHGVPQHLRHGVEHLAVERVAHIAVDDHGVFGPVRAALEDRCPGASADLEDAVINDLGMRQQHAARGSTERDTEVIDPVPVHEASAVVGRLEKGRVGEFCLEHPGHGHEVGNAHVKVFGDVVEFSKIRGAQGGIHGVAVGKPPPLGRGIDKSVALRCFQRSQLVAFAHQVVMGKAEKPVAENQDRHRAGGRVVNGRRQVDDKLEIVLAMGFGKALVIELENPFFVHVSLELKGQLLVAPDQGVDVWVDVGIQGARFLGRVARLEIRVGRQIRPRAFDDVIEPRQGQLL